MSLHACPPIAPAAAFCRYRIALGVFILGLVLCGLTAFPLLAEMRLVGSWLGIAAPERYADYTGLRHWVAFVLFGLEQTQARFPFLAYGTDWLAFGHLAIALFFVRPFFRPHEGDWVLRCGLLCCAGVIPLALIAGGIRGIPFYWRLIDCSFGILGALPLLYCLRLNRSLQSPAASSQDPPHTS